MFSCPRIFVEVDLEKGLLEAINLSMEECNHLQVVDYEQISFKCKVCHEYGHFAQTWPKRKQPKEECNQEKEWNEVSRKKTNNANPNQQKTPIKRKALENSFHVLSSEEKEEEEGEVNEAKVEKARCEDPAANN